MPAARIFRYWWVTLLVSLAGAVVLTCVSSTDRNMHFRKTTYDLRAFNAALELYKSKTGSYPSNAEGLALLEASTRTRIRSDPWGNAYRYELRPFVYSVGADGIDAQGSGDDIVSWRADYHCEQ